MYSKRNLIEKIELEKSSLEGKDGLCEVGILYI